MISIIRIFFILTLLSAAAGCTKNEFNLEFALDSNVSGNYKIAYYAADKRGGIMVESVAPVTAGKASVKGITRHPTLVYLYKAATEPATVIYAERGDNIEITGPSGNPAEWAVGGNDINKAWSEWRNLNSSVISSADRKAVNEAVGKFIGQHPSDPLSTLLLLTSFSRREDESLYLELWRKLDGEAREPKWRELAARADQTHPYAIAPGRLRSMALRSLHNGIDTIRPGSAKACLLFFWGASIKDRKEHIDSVRGLAKEFPDSASRLIADICLEADSTAWRSAARNDSLKNVARLWTPAGLADSRLMSLSVGRNPFYVVVRPDGTQTYRGDDPGAALDSFRALMKNSATSR